MSNPRAVRVGVDNRVSEQGVLVMGEPEQVEDRDVRRLPAVARLLEQIGSRLDRAEWSDGNPHAPTEWIGPAEVPARSALHATRAACVDRSPTDR